MKVELSIADDRELRAAVRDLIKGEVASIMRGELKNILADLVKESVIPKDAATLEALVRAEVRFAVLNVLNSRLSFSTTLVDKIAREEAAKVVREILQKGRSLEG